MFGFGQCLSLRTGELSIVVTRQFVAALGGVGGDEDNGAASRVQLPDVAEWEKTSMSRAFASVFFWTQFQCPPLASRVRLKSMVVVQGRDLVGERQPDGALLLACFAKNPSSA